MTGISTRKQIDLRGDRKIPFYKAGRDVFYKMQEIEDWIADKKVA